MITKSFFESCLFLNTSSASMMVYDQSSLRTKDPSIYPLGFRVVISVIVRNGTDYQEAHPREAESLYKEYLNLRPIRWRS